MCDVNHDWKGKQVEHAANLKLDEATLVEKIKTGTKYKFLGVRESVMEDEKLALTVDVPYVDQTMAIGRAAKYW